MPPVEIRSFLHRLGILVSVVFALSIPGLYGANSYVNLTEKLELKALFVARQLGRNIEVDDAVWKYRVTQLIGMAELPGEIREKHRQRIFDLSATRLLEEGPPIASPAVMRKADILVNGEKVGHVEIETSLRPWLIDSTLVLLFGLMLGLAAYYVIRTIPLRAVDRALDAVEAQNQRLDETLSSMSQGLCRFDAGKSLVVANEQFRNMFGFSKQLTTAGTPIRELLEFQRANGILSHNLAQGDLNDVFRSEDILLFPDGRNIRAWRHQMPDGGWISTFEDVTERKAIESKILELAKCDALTGLANRVVFMETIENACFSQRGGGENFCVMMLDLDKFKRVNDTLGHPVGDTLLVRAAQRLVVLLGDDAIVARLGGDEFAIVLTGLDGNRKAAAEIAGQIIEVLAEPFDIDGMKPAVGASVGIVVAPDDGIDPVVLVKNADMALYKAKADGRNCYRFFDAEMLRDMEMRHQLESDLRAAIDNEELELHYQPIIAAATGLPCGVEALLRWSHPTIGAIPPDRFIPIAEQTGLIAPLGEWVLQKACSDAAAWPDHIKVAVNLSLAQFRKSNLPDVIMCALVESGLAPDRLELEITETIFIANETEHWATLRRLKGLGISVALDDFGTGYSSLSYLTMFPFDKLKIDRHFTQNMASRESCAAVVSSALAIGRGLNMATTAEGVETIQQFELLRAAGVTSVQGFLFGRPMPASALDFSGENLSSRSGFAA